MEKKSYGIIKMMVTLQIYERLKKVLDERIALEIAEAIGEAVNIYERMVTKEEFKELKQVVKELAEAQKRTEERVEELAEAQRKTEEEMRALTREMRDMRKEFGGFQRTISYSFENEAYKKLPKLLKERYGIEVKEKIVRMDIEGQEVNFFAKAKKDGEEFYIVGEVQMKLDEKEEALKRRRRQRDIFEELEEKAKLVKGEYKKDVKKVLVCHFATKGFLKQSKEKGILVMQSFEWED